MPPRSRVGNPARAVSELPGAEAGEVVGYSGIDALGCEQVVLGLNAWAAGCPALVGPEQAFAALRRSHCLQHCTPPVTPRMHNSA